MQIYPTLIDALDALDAPETMPGDAVLYRRWWFGELWIMIRATNTVSDMPLRRFEKLWNITLPSENGTPHVCNWGI